MRLLLLVSLAFASSASAQESLVELRPQDRATVRIVSVHGVRAVPVRGVTSRMPRVVAALSATHGTGLIVTNDGLVLTARHVIEGANVHLVLLPESDEALPARVVHVDVASDVAWLEIPGPSRTHISLPSRARGLRVSEQVSAVGYPVDVQQRSPASSTGSVSRQTNDGHLELSMSVNPGNSGGPVFTVDGELVGIAVARGLTDRGVEGITFVEPLRHVLESQARASGVRGSSPFTDHERAMARSIAWFLLQGSIESNEQVPFDPMIAARVTEMSSRARTPEEAALIAAFAWNQYLAFLEGRSAASFEQLDEPGRTTARGLYDLAVRLARDLMQRAPYMTRHYPALRSMASGRSVLPPGAADRSQR